MPASAAPKMVYDYSGIEAGMMLQVESNGVWYTGNVVQVATGSKRAKTPIKVAYQGYTGYDEWVGGDRIRSKALKTSVVEQPRPAKILKVHAREILDSRGNPTVEVELTTKDGVFRADVPSGASTGENEAVELRDGGSRFLGKGVEQAVKNVIEIIGPKIKGMDARNVKALDDVMIKL